MKFMRVYLSTENVDAVLKFIPKVELKKNKHAYVSFSDVKIEFTTTRWVVIFAYNWSTIIGWIFNLIHFIVFFFLFLCVHFLSPHLANRLYMQFDNLFNGDKVLGAGMNQFLNENWQDILNELKPVLKKAIGKIVKGLVNPIFSKFPYNDLFLA